MLSWYCRSRPGRRIVSACSCPTEHISEYLDAVLQPLVQLLPTYVKDSTNVLNLIEDINQNQNFEPKYLFTMDVTSLYTCIPHSDGLKALKHFLSKRTTPDPPTDTLIRLAELVLNKSNFSFRDEVFSQISGVAMGTKTTLATLASSWVTSNTHYCNNARNRCLRSTKDTSMTALAQPH